MARGAGDRSRVLYELSNRFAIVDPSSHDPSQPEAALVYTSLVEGLLRIGDVSVEVDAVVDVEPRRARKGHGYGVGGGVTGHVDHRPGAYGGPSAASAS